jgi:Fe-S cluster assembly iron-binding protein IscA
VLTLTENASTIVKAIVEQTGAGDDAGIRFSQEGATNGALAVETVTAAQPGDEVVEQGGAKVFLEEGAAVALGDRTLDATVDPEGSVQFSLAPNVEPTA